MRQIHSLYLLRTGIVTHMHISNTLLTYIFNCSIALSVYFNASLASVIINIKLLLKASPLLIF
jgi:hypothetical protein